MSRLTAPMAPGVIRRGEILSLSFQRSVRAYMDSCAEAGYAREETLLGIFATVVAIAKATAEQLGMSNEELLAEVKEFCEYTVRADQEETLQ